MEAFGGVTYTCGALEQWLNVEWCIGYIGYFVTAVVLALLPKLVKDYPASANKAVMLTVTIGFIATMISSAVHLLQPLQLTPETTVQAPVIPLSMSAVMITLMAIS